MPPIVYLVSGANRARGIGFGIVTTLAARDNVVVFAGARNPSTATDLQALAEKYPQKVYVVKIISGDKEGNESAVEQIKNVAGRLDVVIAGAGISDYYSPALETPAEQLLNHFEVNVVGTHVLLQATYPLLQASTSTPKFIAISSHGGSIGKGAAFPVNNIPYGVSKAALNFLMRKIHFEYQDLICFPLHPGAVFTHMFLEAVAQDESMQAFVAHTITVDESAAGIIKVIDGSTREKDGGRFLNYDGSTIEW